VRVFTTLLFLGFACSGHAATLRVSPVPPSNAEPSSLSNPAGGDRWQYFEIRIDQRQPIRAHTSSWLKVANLDPDAKHLVRIARDGKPYASFTFSFKARGKECLCLWFNPLYATWSLSRTALRCPCRK
jgi:hypothetical protein